MPRTVFQPAGISVQVEQGTVLLDAARLAGVDVEAPCGGKGTCGRCNVRVAAGRVEADRAGGLDDTEPGDGWVLACQARVGAGDVVIELVERTDEDGQFGDDKGLDLIESALLPAPEERRPLADKRLLHVPPPRKADGLSDLDRLTRALRQDGVSGPVRYSLQAMRHLGPALRGAEGVVTVTCHSEPLFAWFSPAPGADASQTTEGLWVGTLEEGDTLGRHYGVAVDVGTTTVAVLIVDLATGEVLGVRSDYNGQLACGLDIISRIDYARRVGGREELRRRVLKTINRLVGALADQSGLSPQDMGCAVVSGNTTMIHLLLGLAPESLRLDPFIPAVLSVPLMPAGDIGIAINDQAPVLLSPAVGSYVGGDIAAGLLCTDLCRDGDAICLYLDIGTNGEVVLGNGEFLLAAACSAGPAFEGGGIKWGMRASAGAVERVSIDPSSGRASLQTIGGAKPRGVCGSGMISLMAGLLQTGWLDASGRLARDRLSEAIRFEGRKGSYLLAGAGESANGRDITIDEQDLENIIRAKASLFAACGLMLTEAGLTFRDVSKVYVAGGFGRFLDMDDAIAIGLLPDLPRDRFLFLGNASLKGSFMALKSRRHRDLLNSLARRMTYLELATTPAYMDQYTAALFLPHTDASLFGGVSTRQDCTL